MNIRDRVTAVVPLVAHESEDSFVINAGEVGSIVGTYPAGTGYDVEFSGGRIATALPNDLTTAGETRE